MLEADWEQRFKELESDIEILTHGLLHNNLNAVWPQLKTELARELACPIMDMDEDEKEIAKILISENIGWDTALYEGVSQLRNEYLALKHKDISQK